jgi:hypothetical protein
MQKKLATTMGVFCANLGTDLKLYIEPIMTKLITMIQAGNIELANHAVLAIHSVALSAKDEFVSFYEITIKVVGALMSFTEGTIFLNFFVAAANSFISRATIIRNVRFEFFACQDIFVSDVLCLYVVLIMVVCTMCVKQKVNCSYVLMQPSVLGRLQWQWDVSGSHLFWRDL